MNKTNKLEVIKELKEILKNQDLVKLNDYIVKLEEEAKKENFITKPSEKKKISAIQKILNVYKDIRPVLSGFTRIGNQLAFTDSYRAFFLNDEYLPFDYVASSDESEESTKNYINKYNLKQINGVYPDLKHIRYRALQNFDNTEKITINLNNFLIKYKTINKKDKEQAIFGIQKKDGTIIYYDANYLKSAIDILEINKDFKIKCTKSDEPLYIFNDKNEIGLLLPIRKY